MGLREHQLVAVVEEAVLEQTLILRAAAECQALC